MDLKLVYFLLVFVYADACISAQSNTENQLELALIETPRAQLLLTKPLKTITVGSCNKQNEPQVFWPLLSAMKPDIWLWLGDNIYGDSEDMRVMIKKYNMMLENEAYASFIQQTAVLGIWDDHDFGANNAGEEYPKKEETQQLLLSFLGIPKDNPVWEQEGAYYSYTFGPKGQQTKIIFLDSRYNRDAPKIKNRNYETEEFMGDMLGEDQWNWFENEIKDTAEVYIIANGTQLLPEDHRYEKWANFPVSRNRFLQHAEKIPAQKLILLSGDRHLGEISQITLDNGKIMTELTSSGMTHSYDSVGDEPNRHRIGPIMSQKNVGRILIDWSSQITVTLEIIDEHGEVFHSVTI